MLVFIYPHTSLRVLVDFTVDEAVATTVTSVAVTESQAETGRFIPFFNLRLLTLPMLRLFRPKDKDAKIFESHLKPCHACIH